MEVDRKEEVAGGEPMSLPRQDAVGKVAPLPAPKKTLMKVRAPKNPSAVRARKRRRNAEAFVDPSRFFIKSELKDEGGGAGGGEGGGDGDGSGTKKKRMLGAAKPGEMDALSVLAMASSVVDCVRRYRCIMRKTEERSLRNPDGSPCLVTHLSLNALGGMLRVPQELTSTFLRAVAEDTARGINFCLSEQRTDIFNMFFDVDAIMDLEAAVGMGVSPEINDAMVLAVSRIVLGTAVDFYPKQLASTFACVALVGAVKKRRDGRVKRGIHIHFLNLRVNTMHAKYICMEAGRRVGLAFPCLDRREVSDTSVYECNGLRMPFQLKPKECQQCREMKGNDSGLVKRPEISPPEWNALEEFEEPSAEILAEVEKMEKEFNAQLEKTGGRAVVASLAVRRAEPPDVDEQAESGLDEEALLAAQHARKKGAKGRKAAGGAGGAVPAEMSDFGAVKEAMPWAAPLAAAEADLRACAAFPPRMPMMMAPRHFRADEFYKRGNGRVMASGKPGTRNSVCGSPLCFGARVVEPEDAYMPFVAMNRHGTLNARAMSSFRDMYKVLGMCSLRCRQGVSLTPGFKRVEGCEPPPSSSYLSYPPPRDYAGDVITSVPGVFEDNVKWEAIARTSKNRKWRTMPTIEDKKKVAAILHLVRSYKVRPDWLSVTSTDDTRLARYAECSVEEVRFDKDSRKYAVWIQGRFCNFCENQKGGIHECDAITYFVIDEKYIRAQCTCGAKANTAKRKHQTCQRFNESVETRFADRRLSITAQSILFGMHAEEEVDSEEALSALAPVDRQNSQSMISENKARAASVRSGSTGSKTHSRSHFSQGSAAQEGPSLADMMAEFEKPKEKKTKKAKKAKKEKRAKRRRLTTED